MSTQAFREAAGMSHADWSWDRWLRKYAASAVAAAPTLFTDPSWEDVKRGLPGGEQEEEADGK
jgi:hypothetical protein